MALSNKDLIRLQQQGVKPSQSDEMDMEDDGPSMEEIMSKMCDMQDKMCAAMASMKVPIVQVETASPLIKVEPAKVVIPAAPKRWVFKHSYDAKGNLTDTVATQE